MPQNFRVERKTRYPDGRERQRCSFSYVLSIFVAMQRNMVETPFQGRNTIGSSISHIFQCENRS